MELPRIAIRELVKALTVLVALILCGNHAFASAGLDPTDEPASQGPVLSRVALPLSGAGVSNIEAPRLLVADGGQELRLSGDLVEGLSDRVAGILAANPGIVRLHLTSGGGLVDEGLALGALVGAYGLDTSVSDECASACTLAYVRGHRRHLGPRGRIGFHGPYLIGAMGRCRPANATAERGVYVRAGLTPEFVARALAGGPGAMWFPSAAHLRAAGVVTEAPPVPAVVHAGRTGRGRMAGLGAIR